MRYLDRLQPLALLVLRIVIGTIMIAPGYADKVFGKTSHHPHGPAHGTAHMDAQPLDATEFFGGILIIAGLSTRCVALAMLIDMSVAIWKVHFHNGLKGQGGYEFPLSVAAIAFALVFFGGGPIAFDSLRRGGGRIKSKAAKA